MIDYAAVSSGKVKISDIQGQHSRDDLIRETNQMIDTQLALIAGAPDAYVTFEPIDAHAHDPYATSEIEVSMGWTLGHVIVHATASGEEGAAIGAALARGIEVTERSRYEVHWEEMQRVEQLTQRLEESRRMRLAYLDAWPNEPHLDVLWRKLEDRFGAMNAVGRVLFGLKHDSNHLSQIEEIIRQAREALS